MSSIKSWPHSASAIAEAFFIDHGGLSMNEAINTIKQKYGDLCRLCPPLEEEKYPLAEKRFRRNTFPKV